jgi:hypothetical protein
MAVVRWKDVNDEALKMVSYFYRWMHTASRYEHFPSAITRKDKILILADAEVCRPGGQEATLEEIPASAQHYWFH